ncbi:hypothetical protein SVAN01_06581 [Stagonosporopsis vannaccii]|nr:hypothetical protein SVAN01_06581 [Stagonosporopsis vannaccii]
MVKSVPRGEQQQRQASKGRGNGYQGIVQGANDKLREVYESIGKHRGTATALYHRRTATHCHPTSLPPHTGWGSENGSTMPHPAGADSWEICARSHRQARASGLVTPRFLSRVSALSAPAAEDTGHT